MKTIRGLAGHNDHGREVQLLADDQIEVGR